MLEIEVNPPPSLQWWRGLCRLSSGCWLGGPQVGGIEFEEAEDTWCQISHLSVKSHSGIAPDPGVGTQASPKTVTYPEGLVDVHHPTVPDAHPVVSFQSQLSTCEDSRP